MNALRSAHQRARIDHVEGADRSTAALILLLCVAWLTYTRLYF